MSPSRRQNLDLVKNSNFFAATWYAAQHPDVALSGVDPLEHYLCVGAALGRDPHPLFSSAHYAAQLRGRGLAAADPLVHYLREGWRLPLDPHPLFDVARYLEQNPDIAAAGLEPVGHFLAHGAFEGRQPHRCFPTAEILRRHPELQRRKINPLVYYLEGQWTEDPCPEATRFLDSLRPSPPSAAETSVPPLRQNQPEHTAPLSTDIRALAFYLPQFHAIPENDEWWGPGFTEWTNVRRGEPQYRGHEQPHVPHPDLGYYSLEDPEVMEKQAAMARAAGIEGFVFYYYWFDGRRLLEKPVDRLLATGRPDFPFCFCWANENWTRTWDGTENDVLIGQHHSPESDARFIRDLLPAFRDRRYIRVDGRPLLLIYRPGILPDFAATAERWRRICREEGIGEIYLAGVRSFLDMTTEELGLDALVQFPPLLTDTPNLAGNPQLEVPASFRGFIFDYRKLVEISLGHLAADRQLLPGICPSWDNTARRLERGTSWLNASPASYQRWLGQLVRHVRTNLPAAERFIFINAWNEWAEGCHLEPDKKHGYAWINATRAALDTRRAGEVPRGDVLVVSHDAHRNGAQIVLLSLLREWARRSDAPSFRIVLLGGGPLRREFEGLGDTMALDENADEEERDQMLRSFVAEPPKIILSNTVVNGPWLAKLRALGIPIVTYVHELQKSIERWAPGEIMAATLRNTDHFVAVSPPVRDNLTGHHAVPPECISLLHPFIPVRHRPSRPAGRLREELRLGPDDLVVVGCGTTDHRKGPDLFIKTAAIVCAQLPAARFVWIGGATSSDEHEHLQELIAATGHADRITFIGERAAARDYLAVGHVFYLPSREDPYPLVALEAADAGLPIVCFANSGGMPDFVKNSAGRTVPFEDTAAAATEILGLLRDPAERANLGRTAQAKVRALHDAGQGSMRLAEILLSLLPAAEPAPGPLVSIILPNYNHAKFLPERLASIAGQTYRNIEIILLDDRSSDSSLELLHDFVAKDPRARLVANTVNSGSTFKQWRKGLAEAKGKYVWIAESDDSAHPEMLETLVSRLERNPDAMLAACCPRMTDLEGKDLGTPKDWFSDIGGARWENDFSSPGPQEIADVMSRKNAILNASGVVFRNGPDLVDMVDDSMRLCADWLFWVRLLARGDFEYIARPLNYWRLASSNARTKPPGEIEWDEGSRVLREVAKVLGPDSPGEDRLLEQFRQRCDGWKTAHHKEIAPTTHSSANGAKPPKDVFLQREGWCPICENEVTFSSKQAWLRDHYLCSGCGSIPRERALMHVIQTRYPRWRELRIHESSPGQRGASVKLREQCKHYTATQYDPDLGFGKTHPTKGYRSEDLEKQTFADEEFDLVITQDVMEHIVDTEAAFREIHRTLKPGGAHIFTTPLVNQDKPSQRRVERKADGSIVHLFPPDYHGNPMSPEGSLVTWHWGRDILDQCASLPDAETSLCESTDAHLGIEGRYCEVVVQQRRTAQIRQLPAEPLIVTRIS
jgi:glycosyltransferase involved in cell wall biosynthesis/SAM-dependent methyltransferase